MLAKRELPSTFKQWNEKWGAPTGRRGFSFWPMQNTQLDIRIRGPFAWQPNNTTREFEYPWAYQEIAQHGKNLSIVDIGGSLAGLQFVLGQDGHQVINVDPGLKASGLGWDLNANSHSRLCKSFKANVQLVSETLKNARLNDQSADVVLCISALEHFSDEDIKSTAHSLRQLLKPDGIFVATVDLFLDLAPFSDRTSNKWGRNINIKDFLNESSLVLKNGNPAELLGFPEFDSTRIMSELSNSHVGRHYPCLAQCFTAVKSSS